MAVMEEMGFDVDQFAYMESRSTTQAMLTLFERVKLGLLEGRSCGAIFFDFTDAFGSVDRSILLRKLRVDFNIKGRLFLHIADFLSDRSARLKIGEKMGEWMETNIGTSAGTVLGPILFICHTHDAPKSISPKFADDFNGIAIEDSDCAMADRLQVYADEMSEWSVRNAMDLNAKTKVMSFGSCQLKLCIFVNGKQIEEVSIHKLLGVWVDRQLAFDKHCEFACSKSKAAFLKISILLNGRKGLPVGIGLDTYKALIRPHMEYAIPAWAFCGMNYMNQFESVQKLCLYSILGAFRSSASAAVEVIAAIQPIAIRFKELCIREWARLKSFPPNHPLSIMLECASTNRSLTPLGFIARLSRQLEANLETKGWCIKERQPLTPPLLRQQRSFEMINLFSEAIGSANSRSNRQKKLALEEMYAFLQSHQSNIIVFSDGSAKGAKGGCGSVLRAPDGNISKASSHVCCQGDNVECEVAGLSLSFKQIVEWTHKSNTRSTNCYILSDCESALQIVSEQRDVGRWLEHFQKVWCADDSLRLRSINIILGWVPGHCGIELNEVADQLAKEACDTQILPPYSPVSLEKVVQMAKDMCNDQWQRSWDHATSGHFTKEICPKVGTKLMFPDDRSSAMTMARAILNNAAVADNLFRFKLVDSPDCECREARETVEHVLLSCPKYNVERLHMNSLVCDLWFSSKAPGNLSMDMKNMFNPKMCYKFDKEDIEHFMAIVHKFLSKIVI